MKTIAQQLNIKEFPFEIKDKNNNKLYFENSYGYWIKREFEGNKEVYYKNSKGTIRDNRKPTMTKKEAEKKFNIKIK